MNPAYYPRPEILSRPGLRQGHAIIEASAGTGKTFTLEHLVLDLIITGRAGIEEVLVVTFTDAATRELRERVRALIRKVCDAIPGEKPAGDTAAYWEINDATRGRLREALFRFDGATIATIHGLCRRILSEQAFLGGRLFEQQHADGSEMFGLAFREEVRVALAESGSVGEALRLWIGQENTLPALQDLLYQCHREGCPDRCPVTPQWDPQGFLEAAGRLPEPKELEAGIQAFFPDPTSRNGYERLAERLFQSAAAVRSAASPQEAVALFLDWAGKTRTIKGEKLAQIDHLYRAAAREGAPDVLRDLAAVLEEMALRAACGRSFFIYSFLPRVQQRLAARKRSLGLMDYDDMLLGVREALAGPDAGVLLDALRRHWKYALVDEFQDTDPVQWEIFRRIFVDGKGEHRLFVIGDPKQAIYGFRGADVHTYELAKNHLVAQCGATRLPLMKNYRSTAAMIEAVNAILTARDETGQAFFDGLNRYGEPVRCGDLSRAALEGGKSAAPVHLVHLYGEGEKSLSAASVRRGVACFIAEEILRLTNRETGLAAGGEGREPALIRLSDIYILARTGREGRQIGAVLRRYGIAHAYYKMEGLFGTPEAEDIYRLLGAIDTPADPAARMMAWLTPFFGVPLEDLMAWQGVSENHPLAARLHHWKRLADAQEWARLFDAVLTGSGLIRRLIFSGGERALTNYLHLFETLLADAHARPVTLRELSRGLRARMEGRKMPEGREGDLQRLETDKDSVQILTMHKAKGLEAEVVFIGGGFGDPGGYAAETEIYHRDNRRCLHIGEAAGEIAAAISREKREENQRLAYVALTRARSRLYLPYFGTAPEGGPARRSYGFKGLGAFYKALQKQLDLLRRGGLLDDPSRFVIREVSCLARPPREQSAEISLAGWPGQNLLETPSSRAEEAGRIKRGHRGILLTSYTRMKRGRSWQPLAAEADNRVAWRGAEVEGEVLTDHLSAGREEQGGYSPGGTPVLPFGRVAGIFLHALLEDTPAAEVADRSFAEWSSLPAVQARVSDAGRRHGFGEEHLPAALRLVHSALRTPLRVQSREGNATLEMPGGIASGASLRAEVSFVYPIPEEFHPLLAGGREAAGSGDTGNLPYQARRGYLQGLIDLVFEHKGKVYLLDWKSDGLSAFDRGSLNAHVEAHYSLQARVYALAVIRLLGIRTEEEYESLFGGVLYLFLRGIRPGGEDRPCEGVWFSRPSWSGVAAWEREFVGCSEWGGEVIELEETAGEGWAP